MATNKPRKFRATDPRYRAKRIGLDNSARLLRVARRAAGLSQRRLARLANVDHSFVSLLESGDRQMRLVPYETVVLIARALNVDAEDLVPVIAEGEARAV